MIKSAYVQIVKNKKILEFKLFNKSPRILLTW